MDFDATKVLTILVPLLGGWGAAWLTNRREQRQWQEKQEAEQSRQIQQQSDRLNTGWSEMTAQARDIIDRLQKETIAATKRAAAAEERVALEQRRSAKAEQEFAERSGRLERELAEVQAKYDMARAELETLRERGKRQIRRKEPPGPKNEHGG